MKGTSNGAKTKISNARYSGKIVSWKGKFGWIQPSVQVNHPLANAKRGQIFLDIQDVDADISGEGADVEFFVYADHSGLGAMNCAPAGHALAQTVVPAKTWGTAPQTTMWGAPVQKSPYQPQQATGAPGPRERISKCMFSGKTGYWKNNISWIEPLEPIKHPLFKSKIFLHVKDCASGSQIPEQTNVFFYIYSDGKGLGAEEVRTQEELDETPPVKPKAKAKVKAKADAKAKAKAKGKPAPPKEPPKEVAEAESVPEPEAKEPEAKKAKLLHTLPRDRITTIPTTGDVITWKKAFGFIQPHEPIDHPMASLKKGQIFVSAKDLVDMRELQPGQIVQFHVFADDSGLGAEECSAF